jgi:uncharacterized protein (DUF1778 family)
MRESDEEIIKDMEHQIEEGKELEGYFPIKARVSKNLTVTYAIRLSPDEYSEFNKAAEAHGMTLADFMRNATRAAVKGDVNVSKAAALGEILEKAQQLTEALNRL